MLSDQSPNRAVVFAPAPVLTVTIESHDDDCAIHLHAGGQGFWLARMIAELGAPARLCGSFGGEVGRVLRALIEAEGVDVRAILAQADNPAYVHDRRSGSRVAVAETTPKALSRHEVDELYGAMLAEGLEANVCVFGGTTAAGDAVPPDTYRRLASDLTGNGKVVVADLSGEAMDAAVRGGVTVLKVSDEEILGSDHAPHAGRDDVVAAAHALQRSGPAAVVVSRADRPTIAVLEGRVVEVVAPRFEPVEARGGGDSMTAGIAASLALGRTVSEAVRIGAAAGALNVARRGLGTGGRTEIERVAAHVELIDLEPVAPPETTTPDELAARARTQ
jgi:1-phosphofructokinase